MYFSLNVIRGERARDYENTMQCPKCGYYSGNDWRQCGGSCPVPGSPYEHKLAIEKADQEADSLLPRFGELSLDEKEQFLTLVLTHIEELEIEASLARLHSRLKHVQNVRKELRNVLYPEGYVDLPADEIPL